MKNTIYFGNGYEIGEHKIGTIREVAGTFYLTICAMNAQTGEFVEYENARFNSKRKLSEALDLIQRTLRNYDGAARFRIR